MWFNIAYENADGQVGTIITEAERVMNDAG